MTQAEKFTLINKFRVWKDATRDYEDHPGATVKEQAAQEALSDKVFWELVDASSNYLGHDSFSIISSFSTDTTEDEFIRALS